ncbi:MULTISPECIES: hypothetical protein [Mycobacterium]|uniref:hypothetical protein n=1 Tax=Mycobacterium TaxID=1763 RepID=UPI001EEFD2C4|nr:MULTISPECIES: hypothetical protein [Mycobacterium]
MAPLLEVNVQNVLAGVKTIAAAKTTVAAIHAPDTGSAAGGLAGFETAGALGGVQEAVDDSLRVVAGRYEKLADMIRTSVTLMDVLDQVLPAQARQELLTRTVGKAMTALGDMNPAA